MSLCGRVGLKSAFFFSWISLARVRDGVDGRYSSDEAEDGARFCSHCGSAVTCDLF